MKPHKISKVTLAKRFATIVLGGAHMKKLLFLAGMAIACSLAAQTQQAKPEQKPDKSGPSVTGKWTMTLDMSMGVANPTLELKQNSEKITGTYTGRYGTFPLEGKLKDRAIQFAFTMVAEGESVTMEFTGEVAPDGQTMKGTATLGEMGDATWSAKKDKSVEKAGHHLARDRRH